jgi:DHA2 family multidrug resistance protein-like MFS transporter
VARDTLGGAVTAAGQLPGNIGTELLQAARSAFTHGLNGAALGAAIVMVVAAVLSALFFRGVQVDSPPTAAHQPQGEADKELAAR